MIKHFKKNSRLKRNKSNEFPLLRKWISELRKDSKTKLVIVEGKKDKEALEKLGIKSIQLHKTNNSLNERVELFSKSKECILLFDLDRAGRKLHAKIKESLQRLGVKVNSRYRNFLLTKTRLRFIEGINTYLKHLE